MGAEIGTFVAYYSRIGDMNQQVRYYTYGIHGSGPTYSIDTYGYSFFAAVICI